MGQNAGSPADDARSDDRITVRIREACRITGIGRSKLYELIAAGDIPILKVGAITLVPIEGLKAFVAGRRSND
jgi:excisionase family DNA binding protein